MKRASGSRMDLAHPFRIIDKLLISPEAAPPQTVLALFI